MNFDYNRLNKISEDIGDAFYILDIDRFKRNFHELEENFKQHYLKTSIAYSYKTNYIPSIVIAVHQEGGYAEVVSEMEYDLALRIGVEPSKIIVNGPCKTKNELEKYFLNGSIVNLDSYNEAEMLWRLIESNPDKVFNLGIRCNFDLGDNTISRFGFDVEQDSFFTLIKELIDHPQICFINLHCHYPSRALQYFEPRIKNLIALYRKINRDGQPSMLDIGGGLGGKVHPFIRAQLPFEVSDYKDYANVVGRVMKTEFEGDERAPRLIMEPGTALVADTMSFFCRVQEIKHVRGKVIAMTSGTKINFNPMASTINMPVVVYNSDILKSIDYESIDLSGYTCMEGDYLHKNYKGHLGIGDFIEVENAGSYSIVFKPPFIRPNVPIISVNKDSIEVVKRAEAFEDIFNTYHI